MQKKKKPDKRKQKDKLPGKKKTGGKLILEKHHGKKREGKAKKISTLKKNILREKKRQAELLLGILKGKLQQ